MYLLKNISTTLVEPGAYAANSTRNATYFYQFGCQRPYQAGKVLRLAYPFGEHDAP